MTNAGELIWSQLTQQWARLQALSPEILATDAILTAAMAAAGFSVLWLARRLFCSVLQALPHLSKSERKAQARRAFNLTYTTLSVLVAGSVVYLALELWGFDVHGWLRALWGGRFVAPFLHLIFILLFAAAAMEAAGLSVNYAMTRLKARAEDDARRLAQLDTLGPIFRSSLQTAILVIALMTLLAGIGIQIAPILAGAGVVGIAIGFGAQTLVKDFFTGFFLLIEDIVAVGDVVQVQAFSGTVEQMTLRTIRLRDFDGTLHVLPYGEAQIIHNMTKTFSYAAFDVWLRPDADVSRAIAIMQETATALKADDEAGPLIIGPAEIVGLDAMTDLGVLIKGRLRTRPHDRWRVLRAYNERLKQALDAAGLFLGHKA